MTRTTPLAIPAFLLAASAASAQEFTAGHLFLASRANNKVIEFSGTLGKVREIDTSAFLQAPVGVAFGPNGHLYLTSDTQDKVVEIDSTGASVAPAFGAGTLSLPKGLAFGPQGNLFVTSANTDEITEWTPAGNFVRAFGSGNLDGPFAIVFGPGGHLYAASFGGEKICEFDISSTFIRDIGATASVLDPRGLAILPNGNLGLTSQSPSPSVLEFNSLGVNVNTISGVANMGSAHSLVVGPDGNLFVSSLDNNNIVRFTPGGAKLGEATAADGISEAYQSAFAPYRFKANISGKLVKPGSKTVNVAGPAIVSYAPGSRILFVQFVDDPKKPNDPFNALNRSTIVFHGFESISADLIPQRQYKGTEVTTHTLEDGESSLAVRVRGKTDATTGLFTVTKIMGSLQVASTAGVFYGNLNSTILLK